MNPDENPAAVTPAPETPAVTPPAPDSNVITLSREEHDKLLQDLGSLKRENKDLKKPKEPEQSATPDELIQKTYLRAAQITAEDEVELALSTAKKWDMTLDKLVDDEDFQTKLSKLRTQKANDLATSGLKGGPGSKGANLTADFYIERGTPPSRDEVPDRKTRAGIARAMIDGAKNGKKFHND